jgi:hypothetical protein
MTAEWAAAFAKAQAGFPAIPKTKTVDTGSFSYKYADLPSIIEAVAPHLEGEGLSVGQSVVSDEGRVGVETRIYHISGHVETFGPVFLPAGNDAKSAGSAITYARRYSLCAALGIAADEDDDGQAATREAPTREDPAPDLAELIRNKVAVFKNWTEDDRRAQFLAHSKKVLQGKPKNPSEVDLVVKSMAEDYYEAHPAPEGEAPF